MDLKNKMDKTTSLYGLILAGGKSTRMGSDKGVLDYHGVPQRQYLFDLAQQFCDDVFYSIREDQIEEFLELPNVVDENKYRGPLNGILSAHQQFPEVAWLVLACDLPLLDSRSIETLVAEREVSKTATAYATSKTGLPEPLVSIWEPSGLVNAIEYMEEAQSSCPRKFLINSDIKLVTPQRDEELYNANSLEEFQEAKTLLK